MGMKWEIRAACPVRTALGAELPVAKLLRTPEAFAEHASHCEGCPARAVDRPFGCVGVVAYPIPLAAEELMMSRLPKALDSTAGSFMRKMLADFHYDGKKGAKLRGHDGKYFEAAVSARREWKGWLNRYEVTFDQLFELIFVGRRIDPSRGLLILLVLGVLDPTTKDKYMAELAGDERRRQVVLHSLRNDLPPASEPAGALHDLVEAIRLAGALSADVHIKV